MVYKGVPDEGESIGDGGGFGDHPGVVLGGQGRDIRLDG
jgi:hypothetical protein